MIFRTWLKHNIFCALLTRNKNLSTLTSMQFKRSSIPGLLMCCVENLDSLLNIFFFTNLNQDFYDWIKKIIKFHALSKNKICLLKNIIHWIFRGPGIKPNTIIYFQDFLRIWILRNKILSVHGNWIQPKSRVNKTLSFETEGWQKDVKTIS